MTQPQCACGQPVNGTAICGACETDLAAALNTVTGWLAAALDDAVSRQARFGGGGRRGAETALPYDERASAAAGALRNALAGAVRVLAETGR